MSDQNITPSGLSEFAIVKGVQVIDPNSTSIPISAVWPEGACRSTHGGADYVQGTYISELGEVFCGACGEFIGHVDSESRIPWRPHCRLLPLPNWIEDRRPQ